MATVLKSADAERDLLEIWVYIAERNYDAADRLLEQLDEKFRLLSENPGFGTMRDDLAPSVRGFPVGNYVLFYRPITGGIEVVRVIHGARDIPRQFRRR